MSGSKPQYSLESLAELFGLELRGHGTIEGVATLEHAGARQLAFLANRHYLKHLRNTRAGAVIVPLEHAEACPVPALVAPDPYLAYAKVAALFEGRSAPSPGIHPSAVVDPHADVDAGACIGPFCVIGAGTRIDAGVVIGPHCIIGEQCTVGSQSRLEARVTLMDNVRLGKRGLIHSGAIIGGDGFGLAVDGDHWIKVPQLGGVRLGDDCEIGCNTTIDRGAIEDTVLGNDVRLDNLIQIAHNVHVGDHTAMAGCAAVAGSAHIGRWCMIGGNAGILGHLTVADHVVITAKSLVTHSIDKPGQYSSGVPIQDATTWRRNAARFKHLDDIARRLTALERNKHD